MQITQGSLREALGAQLGSVLTPELAAQIEFMAYDRAERAIDPARFAPVAYRGLHFAVESFRAILPELEPLHAAHFAETERHLPGDALNPDYDYMAERERMGSLIQFTVRDGSLLVGNLRAYLSRSTHTGRQFAEEDTIYLAPAARLPGVADAFMDYAEAVLVQLGMIEARADTKLVNLAGKWLRRRGYRPIATKFIKQLRKD
jgi:GNAT superfamily N-acetyltransferase